VLKNSFAEAYFDVLARNRLNHFLLILGYKNAQYKAPIFTAPACPYFFDVAEFPEVQYVGMTARRQERNCAALKHMIRIAHDRGIQFSVGLWDQIDRATFKNMEIPESTSSNPAQPPEGLPSDAVWGVTTENLAPYNKTAFRKFLRTFPEIDGIQFRMHWEAGLKREEMGGFWHEMFETVKEERSNLQTDARAKGVPDEILFDGLDMGLNLRVATKFWME
jgi:hypothetical protein